MAPACWNLYIAALAAELKREGLAVRKEVAVPVVFQEEKLELGFRIDLLIEEKVLIEVKSIKNIAPVHHKQTFTYLKLTGLKLGIPVNFNVDNINDGIHRKGNNL